MKANNKGFTLLEVAVVLAVIAILAAMLTPIVTSYIDQARTTRAQNDVKKIAEGVLLYKRDTGFFPGFSTLADARLGVATFNTSIASCMVTGPTTSSAVIAGWNCGTHINYLDAYLNVNSIGLTSTNLSNNTGGMIGYRGPYLDGLTGLDPWGNPYVVNSADFVTANHVVAVSGGPNSRIDTTQAQTASVTFTGDDIGSIIK